MWDMGSQENLAKTMAVSRCFQVTMPLFPAAVIFEFVAVRRTSFDATKDHVSFRLRQFS
jgi:hypothetical protein